jgi:hypothetical protein
MNGRPVWLASASKRNRQGRIVPNTRWPSPEREKAKKLLRSTVEPSGDWTRWRMFRMQITYCLHVAVSDAEIGRLPVEWQSQSGTCLAGGPVEILASSGIPDQPSVLPCEHPTRVPLGGLTGSVLRDPDLWVPEDCGRCLPCRSRAAIEARCAI